MLEIGSERVWVSSVSTNTLTITRAYGGSAASAAASATITVVNMARLEGADTTDDYKTDVTAPYNYTQIFHGGIKVTGTMAKLAQWGISDEFDYQANKKVPELTRLIEKAFFRGDRKSGSATAPRAFGGLETFVTDNTRSMASAALDEVTLNNLAQDCFDDGGRPDTIFCGPWVKRKISSLYRDSVRTERSEERGGVIINYVDTEFGEMKVIMSRWCPAAKLYMVQSDYIGFLPYRPFFQEPMAKSGDYDRGQVIGEYSLVVKHDKAHGFIKSISTSS